MPTEDYENSVKVAEGVHWVGFFDEYASLHCNPFLLVDDGEGILIDPGSLPDFPVIMRKIIDVIYPERISTIIVSHQDPDVCGNLAVVEDVIDRDDLKIVAHTSTLRLIRHYGLRSDLYAVDQNDFVLQLKSGRVLEFLFTPYLHAPGAIVTYDPETQNLFTGDIFGAISREWSVFAQGNYLSPMGEFHKLYMPSNQILRAGMEKISRYDIARILPQHGSVLTNDQVSEAIEYLKNLPCGIDIE